MLVNVLLKIATTKFIKVILQITTSNIMTIYARAGENPVRLSKSAKLKLAIMLLNIYFIVDQRSRN